MTQVTRPNFTPEVIEWFNNPETTLEEIYSEYSDAYKSIQGIRPRWVAVWSTKEAAADDYSWLIEELKESHRLDIEMSAQAEEMMEAAIARTIASGASDRRTALRWLTAEEKFKHTFEIEGYVWRQGLIYGTYGATLQAELRDIWRVDA